MIFRFVAMVSVAVLASSAAAASTGSTLEALRDRVRNEVAAKQTYQTVGQINKWVLPDSRYTGVGGLFIQTRSSLATGAGFLCSGSLIGSGSVLSAAHCLDAGTVDDPISRIQFYLPSYVNADGTTTGRVVINATGYLNNPNFTGDLLGGYDVSVVTLSTAAPADREIYELYAGDGELDNASYQKVGTGSLGTGFTGTFEGPGEPSDFDFRKRLGLNEYEYQWSSVLEGLGLGTCVTSDAFGAPCDGILAFDMDSGREKNDVFGRFLGKPDLGQFIGGLAADANSSPGDSGGPTFIDGQIAGVTSFGITGNVFEPGDCAIAGSVDPSKTAAGGCTDSSFGEISGDARVARYLDFLDPFTGPGTTVRPAVVRLSVVPEPGTWALMIAGFGLVGAALRRRAPIAA